MKNRNHVGLSIIALFLLTPEIAYAGPTEWGVRTFHTILFTIGSSIVSGVWSLLEAFLLQPTDLGTYVTNLLEYSQWIAYAWLTYLVTQEYFTSMYRQSAGVSTATPGQLAIRTISSAFMIFFVQEILHIMIEINNYLVVDVLDLAGTTQNFSRLLVPPGMIGEGANWSGISLFFVLLAISVLYLTIVCAMRYVEIAALYCVGPMIMASGTDDWKKTANFFREAVAVIFTQSLQLGILAFAMNRITNLDVQSYLLAVASVWVMIKGSSMLRRYLYTAGSGGGKISTEHTHTSFVTIRSWIKGG